MHLQIWQEMELYKLYTPKVTQTPDQIKNTEKNQYRAKAIESINNEFFQGCNVSFMVW